MTVRHARPLVVVGGGLAGLAAAVTAQRAGLATCLVEQQPALRGPRRLLAAVAASGVETWPETAVWGIWGRDLALCGPRGQSAILTFEQLIVASGAFARPVAFPGWTLPGVITVGSESDVLEPAIAPGQRVVVAGYGPFVAAAARDLQQHGIEPLAVLDAAARDGRLVVRAAGDGHLQRVVSARSAPDWSPQPGTEQVIDPVDALVLAFGRLPEDQLARLAGCALDSRPFVDPHLRRDAWLRSSVPGVLVAGDAGGIVGAAAAVDQGRLAGLAAALDAGTIEPQPAERLARPIRRRLADRPLLAASPRPGLFALADPETVICRCEHVTAGHLAERRFAGSIEPGPLIAETRAGMGICQGRQCASLIAATIARHAGLPIEHIPPITPRPPIVPVPLGAIAERPPMFPPLVEPAAAL